MSKKIHGIDYGFNDETKVWWDLINGEKVYGHFYYMLPLEDITNEIKKFTSITDFEKRRKSIRPIDNKIHYIIQFTNSIPLEMKPYTCFRAKEMRDYLNNSKEWNIAAPLQELKSTYDFEKIIYQVEQKNYIQAFGMMYISIFDLLKYLFFTHNFNYLKSNIKKWKIFKQNPFEGANEFTLLQMCYFYNLITEEDKQKIDSFRNIRNNIMHSNSWNYADAEFLEILNTMNSIFNYYSKNDFLG